jgi:hypothetical protein
MVMDIVHTIKYVIEFKQPVDYFNVILQKQIDLRLKFSGNVNNIIVFDLNTNNKRFTETNFYSKYKNTFSNFGVIGQNNYSDLTNLPNKYFILKHIFNEINFLKYIDEWTPELLLKKDGNKIEIVSCEEFEYNVDLMLEEFKVFCDNFEFNLDEKKIIDSIIQDENLKSNIKFCGWKDYWETH